MRIAFIRSVDVQQAFPALANFFNPIKSKHELKLFYTDGVLKDNWFPGEIEKVDVNLTVQDISCKLLEWNPDVVISISLPDNNCMRDSVIREELARYNIPVVIHPLNTMIKLCNKWDTVRYLREAGFNVPNSFLISGDLYNKRGVEYKCYFDVIKQKIFQLNFPVLIKPLWDSMSLGIKKFDDSDTLLTWLNDEGIVTDVLVEEFIQGELFGIEVVGSNGSYYCHPLIKKSMSCDSDNLIPFDHIRFGPINDSRYNIERLTDELIKIAKFLELFGSVEFELIFHKEIFYIIEINPRVSGLTNLSSSISGENIYSQLLNLAEDKWFLPTEKKEIDVYKAEVPLNNLDEHILKELNIFENIECINEVLYHDGSKQSKMIIGGENFNDLLQQLKEINTKFNIIDKSVVVEFEESLY